MSTLPCGRRSGGSPSRCFSAGLPGASTSSTTSPIAGGSPRTSPRAGDRFAAPRPSRDWVSKPPASQTDMPPEEALPPASDNQALAEFSARCDAIEEAYEFMLAYAAQGLSSEHGSASGNQIREFLRNCDAALAGFVEAARQCVRRLDIGSQAPYDAFITVIERDVESAQAAVQ